MCQRASTAPSAEARKTKTSERASCSVSSAARRATSASPKDATVLTQASAPSGAGSRACGGRRVVPLSSAWYAASSASSSSFLGNRK